MTTRKKRGRATTVDGVLHHGEWDEDWDAEGLTLVTDDQTEYIVAPDRLGRRLAEHVGDTLRLEALLDQNDSRGCVLRVRSFEILEVGLVSSKEDDDEGPEDEERISSMGFRAIRS